MESNKKIEIINKYYFSAIASTKCKYLNIITTKGEIYESKIYRVNAFLKTIEDINKKDLLINKLSS